MLLCFEYKCHSSSFYLLLLYSGIGADDTATDITVDMTADSSEVKNPMTQDLCVPEAEYLLPDPTTPPTSRVWVRIKSSKSVPAKGLRPYYFVLEKGHLTMFKDSLKSAPYGVRPKGSIFLINHRAESSSIPGEGCVALLLHIGANLALSSKRSGGGVTPRSFFKESVELQKKATDTAKSGTKEQKNSSFLCFGGSKAAGTGYLKILFATRDARQEWLVAVRHHISWASAHTEDSSLDVTKAF